jgi:hypothetical protein
LQWLQREIARRYAPKSLRQGEFAVLRAVRPRSKRYAITVLCAIWSLLRSLFPLYSVMGSRKVAEHESIPPDDRAEVDGDRLGKPGPVKHECVELPVLATGVGAAREIAQ